MKNRIIGVILLFFTLVNISNSQWIKVSNTRCFVLTSLGNNIFMGTPFGIYNSTNSGLNWTSSGLAGFSVLDFAVNGNNIYAGAGSQGVYLSTDIGLTWTSLNNGLGNPHVNALASGGNNLYAGKYYGGVYLSTNNGSSWTAVNNGLTSLWVKSLAVNGNNTYVSTEWEIDNGGLFLSTNNGVLWLPINNGFSPHIEVGQMVFSGNNIFAGTYSGGVYLSTNNGSLWSPVNNGLTSYTVSALAINGNNLFAGAFDAVTSTYSVYLSTNLGQSWIPKNEGLITNNVLFFWALNITGDYIFAGMSDGVWRRSLSEITIAGNQNTEVPEFYHLYQNYPNPFNPITKIKYDIVKLSYMKLIIYDILGKEIVNLVNQQVQPGSYEVEWNAVNYPSGVYYCRITAGDYTESKKMILLK